LSQSNCWHLAQNLNPKRRSNNKVTTIGGDVQIDRNFSLTSDNLASSTT
jgi:hypothetical protein